MTDRFLPGNRLHLTALMLVAANLLPLAGVFYFGWTVYEILLLFWAENLIIGFYTVMRFVTVYRRTGDGSALWLAPFFCVHYGLFTLVHGAFVVAMFRPDTHDGGQASGLWLPLLALLASHGASYVMHFIGNREYRDKTARDLMGAPYRRVMILHVTIIAGGFVVTWLGQPIHALALLVVLKIVIDLATHRAEHRREREAERRERETGRADSHIFRNWD